MGFSPQRTMKLKTTGKSAIKLAPQGASPSCLQFLIKTTGLRQACSILPVCARVLCWCFTGCIPAPLTTRVMQMETDYLCFLDRAFSRVPAHLLGLKAKNRANTYLYLTVKATHHLPTRKKSVQALCVFAKAVRALWQPGPQKGGGKGAALPGAAP